MSHRYLLIALVLLLVLGAFADEQAGERLPVLVLPIEAGEETIVSNELTAELTGAMERAVLGLGGLASIPLPEAMREEEGCRRDPACLLSHLPEGAMVLDLRVSSAGEALLIFDLRLLASGRPVSRRSAVAGRAELAQVIFQATEAILMPHAPMIGLYRRALGGDEGSRTALVERYPESPWTRALLSIEQEPASGMSKD